MSRRLIGLPLWALGGLFAWLALGCSKSQSSDSNVSQGGRSTGPSPVREVVINELMYHPVLENDHVERHEFIELYNRSAAAVSLANWRLGGEVSFVFPATASMAPGRYLVVAKDAEQLGATYSLGSEAVLGNYDGQLDNGGGRLDLMNAQGTLVDTVTYDDAFPWPLGADALGAGESWLSADLLPLSSHQYRGRSLERYSPDIAASEVANWEASPVDGATPGAANTISGEPPPMVEALSVAPMGGAADALIREGTGVTLKATFSNRGQAKNVQVEYFVDDVQVTGEPTQTLPMTGSSTNWQATLPAQSGNSIVRYRIVADRGRAAEEVVTPRPSDPLSWHAYFVSPTIQSNSQVYQLFISRADWGRLWDNLQDWNVIGCAPYPASCSSSQCEVNPRWNARVKAVMVYQGRVYDVLARYQGSRHNRRSGPALGSWPTPGPTSTARLNPMVLSWSLKFPRYQSFEGKDTLVLNKLKPDLCNGVGPAVLSRIYRSLGVPFYPPRFVRVYINGIYYHYMMESTETAESMLKATFPDQPTANVYEAAGYLRDEGPWGFADERTLPAYCGYTPAERYFYNYDKKTNDWEPHTNLIALLEGLDGARAQGTTTARSYLDQHFDLEALLDYVAVRNWSSAWDDTYHNHYLLERGDGKWLVYANDVDGELNNPSYPVYAGSQESPTTLIGVDTFNRIKDTVILHMRAELNQRFRDLANNQLSAAAVAAVVDQAASDFNLTDAQAAPAWNVPDSAWQCDLNARLNEVKAFAQNRNRYVLGNVR